MIGLISGFRLSGQVTCGSVVEQNNCIELSLGYGRMTAEAAVAVTYVFVFISVRVAVYFA